MGSGSSMKLAINLPLAIYWKTLSEALSMLEGSGIPADIAVSMIAGSSAGPTVIKNRSQVVIDTLRGTDQPGTFDLAGLFKDLNLAISQAASNGKTMPLADATIDSYREALAAGLGRFDGASLTRFLLKQVKCWFFTSRLHMRVRAAASSLLQTYDSRSGSYRWRDLHKVARS